MATIAIDHNTISADGRITFGDQIQRDDDKKVFKIGKAIVAYAGSVPDSETLIDIAFNGADVPDTSLDANILTIDDGVPMMHDCTDGVYKFWQVHPTFAIGSGEMYALAAMDLGKTSREAVKYAMTRDIYSGGKIKTMTWRK